MKTMKKDKYLFTLGLRRVLYKIYGAHTILLHQEERHSYVTYDKYYTPYYNDNRKNRCQTALAIYPLEIVVSCVHNCD